MPDLNALKKRRAYIKGSMTKLLNFISSIDDDTNIEEVKVRLTHVERYRIEFNDLEDKIVAMKDEEELDAEFEDNYYRAVAGLNQALRKLAEPTGSHNDTSFNNSLGGHMDVKLPKLSIPTFSGDYTEWQSFHDLFCSTIHDNPKLTPSQKLQYLKGTLKGEAANLLKHFCITDANYIEAVQKLRDRYDRKRYMIHAFIKNFMQQPTITTANSANVRQLLDNSDEILRGIKALGAEAESRDHWLIYVLVGKLDNETASLWAQASAEYVLPTVKQLFDFLVTRVDALETIKGSIRRSAPPINNPKPNIRSHVASSPAEIPLCLLCRERHRLFECIKFKNMPIDERRNVLKTQNRCFNCLNDNHTVYTCKSRFRCRQCNRKHHTLLHEDVVNQREGTENKSNDQFKQKDASTSNNQISASVVSNIQSALLPTALVKVLDRNNEYQLCRILLDSGSQGSFITERCTQRLHLKRNSAKFAISGIGAAINGYTRGAVTILMTPWNRPTPKFQIEALILPRLTAKPPSVSELIDIDDYKSYDLADPHFYKGEEIDIIIGADNFFELISDGKIVTKNQFILQNTLLGWVIAGKSTRTKPQQSNTIIVENPETNLETLLKKFWTIETIETSQPQLSPEELICEKSFDETSSRDSSGRFKVHLPFKISPSVLGDSYPKAAHRMLSIERRFARDPEFACLYKDFMAEYLTLGHMKLVERDSAIDSAYNYYLPHHGVIKHTGSTTKLRVVFDGSAKTTTGKSLNDCLAVGPIIQSSLYDILLRFRKYRVAITADIEKMYRQVRVAEPDTKLQRIIWREEPTKTFDTYELQTVTYGTASASYLATRAVVEAANTFSGIFPQAVNCIKNDMYVDDLMTGAETLDEAIQIKQQINHILSSSGFQLRKWLSNYPVLADKNDLEITSRTIEIDESTSIATKVLGLYWNPGQDTFQFKISLDNQPTNTKRGILSEASRLFDPMGWMAPVTISIKIFFQTLWSENLGWDDEIPLELLNEWLILRGSLSKIEDIKLKRCLSINSHSKIALYGFSDASKRAYSAVVYAKITGLNKEPILKLISSKTKVAPVKQLSIPRLELCGAVLLSKLLLTVKKALQSDIEEIVAFTDSTIVLNWLNAHPNKWNTFVGNRTGDILTHFDRSQWRHVSSQDNPADCASRGLEPEKLQHFDLWWNGPKWLINVDEWPEDVKPESNTAEDLRVQVSTVQIPHQNVIDNLTAKVSRFNTVTRILAYVLRYIDIKFKRVRKKDVAPYLTSTEIKRSLHIIFRHIQSKYFAPEIKLINSQRELPASSRIKYFKPFIDESGLLRVGGRISNASITYDVKHPILLTAQDQISEMIVRDHHLRHLHAGPTLMMATLRQKYWIIGARNLIRKVTHSCIKCVKYNARTLDQQMGQLPNHRVELVRPFYKVGVDYAGPVQTYFTRGRGQKPQKSYICIFVCLATKAVHIELASDLTTNAYLAALRRFIARRGIPKEIHSDNGTNFVGARNHLHQFFTCLKQNFNNISNFLLADQITFQFIPPSAPHFGGLWEAAVKRMKYHLKRVTDGHILTIDEMSTLLTEIESMLNSRPLCVLSEDDSTYLTPSHFLIGRPSTQLPTDDLKDVKMSRLARWQQIHQMNQNIWRRWHTEYLTSMQRTSKWYTPKRNINLDAVVLINDGNLPPCKWLMGKVIKLHPGADGNVRVVTVKTTSGTIRRPIHKICLLPVN